ncbi:Gfo/Idh/MocA family oxidoreductase [Paenibacillus chondroitinus]|uniref:Gfo/Idh/MocA family oxidoreductase n=1 Tax=Paenibacillus chondroitinus TaxID=59842 RepID=A0ABU6D905_9BACL|nr:MULTISPECIES: Gfo/Idh/MocA family oxidoreductase [Paenibacillus]MCY9656586.1 Gfo/Idh/MocA family oxidoreductase [Paenibacillus anseongense]MEB4794235.1 Gfo/Idh/MocA family oxidoreductase [Paenibacillus chondroitinus]
MSNHQQQANHKKIGVGIIGASPSNPGWAVAAHIPAVQALPDFQLVAVSTSNRESAEAAAEAFGVPGFDNYQDLIQHPDVDLVVIAINVQYHYDIARAAIEAGKMVYSEWPLGMSTEQAQDLVNRAKEAGVRTFIGLQARYSPAIQHARDLITQGYIGNVLATTLSGTALIWEPVTIQKFAYTYDVNAGATMLASAGLHAIDGLNYVLGDYDNVSAKLEVRHPEVQIADNGTTLKVTAPDHMAIIGTLESGVLATTLYRSGTSRDFDLRWEIIGTDGELVITADFNGNMQNTELKLRGGKGEDKTLGEIVIPSQYTEDIESIPEGPARSSNIGKFYASLAKDLREGTTETPDFAHALKRHRLYDTIMTASRTGVEQKVNETNTTSH